MNPTLTTKDATRDDADTSSETFWCQIMNAFVRWFNVHIEQRFIPSYHLCVDVSTLRWQGKGAGYWINHGLSQYVAIYCNPEAGYEIHNTACGHSRIMLGLKLVKMVELESAHAEADANIGLLLHSTKVLKLIVLP
jgi:hypothetical protein